jgi:hypothetical protein
MTVYEKISALQKGKENTAPWMVGEQLKDICRREPRCEQIVLEDLENPDMSLEKCEQKIKAWADKQSRNGNCVCVPPNVAESIIREFYGLGDGEVQTQKQSSDFLELDLFM